MSLLLGEIDIHVHAPPLPTPPFTPAQTRHEPTVVPAALVGAPEREPLVGELAAAWSAFATLARGLTTRPWDQVERAFVDAGSREAAEARRVVTGVPTETGGTADMCLFDIDQDALERRPDPEKTHAAIVASWQRWCECTKRVGGLVAAQQLLTDATARSRQDTRAGRFRVDGDEASRRPSSPPRSRAPAQQLQLPPIGSLHLSDPLRSGSTTASRSRAHPEMHRKSADRARPRQPAKTRLAPKTCSSSASPTSVGRVPRRLGVRVHSTAPAPTARAQSTVATDAAGSDLHDDVRRDLAVLLDKSGMSQKQFAKEYLEVHAPHTDATAAVLRTSPSTTSVANVEEGVPPLVLDERSSSSSSGGSSMASVGVREEAVDNKHMDDVQATGDESEPGSSESHQHGHGHECGARDQQQRRSRDEIVEVFNHTNGQKESSSSMRMSGRHDTGNNGAAADDSDKDDGDSAILSKDEDSVDESESDDSVDVSESDDSVENTSSVHQSAVGLPASQPDVASVSSHHTVLFEQVVEQVAVDDGTDNDKAEGTESVALHSSSPEALATEALATVPLALTDATGTSAPAAVRSRLISAAQDMLDQDKDRRLHQAPSSPRSTAVQARLEGKAKILFEQASPPAMRTPIHIDLDGTSANDAKAREKHAIRARLEQAVVTQSNSNGFMAQKAAEGRAEGTAQSVIRSRLETAAQKLQ